MNAVTPKAGAKHKLLFNKPAFGNWNFQFESVLYIKANN